MSADLSDKVAAKIERLQKHRRIARKINKQHKRLLKECEIQIQTLATALRHIKRHCVSISHAREVAQAALGEGK